MSVLIYGAGFFLLCALLVAIILRKDRYPTNPHPTKYDKNLLAEQIAEAQVVPVSISTDTEKKLSQLDWSVKDVMVGTVRTLEQLQFCLAQRIYYTPARLYHQDTSVIKYIALHEESLGNTSGIKRYGEICEMQTVNRGSIPVSMRPGTNPEEEYCYFTIKQWIDLPCPIEIRDSFRGKPQFTNHFLLHHCTRSYQLFTISSEQEYRLMLQLHAVLDRLSDCSTQDTITAYRISSTHALLITDHCLIVANNHGEILEKIPLNALIRHPRSGFNRIKAAIK